MKLPGIVTNITAFGAFVDIGVHQDGLVHISELSNRFVKNPNEVVKVHQKVMVTVLNVEIERKRISLSMRNAPLQAVQTHGVHPVRNSSGHSPRQSDSGHARETLNPATEQRGIISNGVNAGQTREQKGGRKDPVRKGIAQKQLFNNPFADALKDR